MRKIAIFCLCIFSAIFTQVKAEVPYLGTTTTEIQQSINRYTQLAEKNDVQAQYYLGCIYYAGASVPKNDALAVKWWFKSADQQHARSINNIGSMYYEGHGGLDRDTRLARQWWIKAAEFGDDYAI